jgi:hypothetical protein
MPVFFDKYEYIILQGTGLVWIYPKKLTTQSVKFVALPLWNLSTAVLESEFPQLRPKKNGLETEVQEKDIEIIKIIKHLLYDEKFTISGAREKTSVAKKPLKWLRKNILVIRNASQESSAKVTTFQMKLELAYLEKSHSVMFKKELTRF